MDPWIRGFGTGPASVPAQVPVLRRCRSGTGAGLNGPGIPLAAGKTGTAEDSTGGPDHAWFGCYAPYPDGKIVVVAFAQNTPGGGSVHALPMAKKVLAEWERTRQR